MTDPKNSEQQSEELSLDQLKDAAGGLSMTMPDVWNPTRLKSSVSSGGCGGEDKNNIAGSADPGGDDI